MLRQSAFCDTGLRIEMTPQHQTIQQQTLEISIGKVLTTGHWQIPSNAPHMEWEWNAREAEKAFGRACLLVGRRVRRGLVVDGPAPMEQPPPRSSRH